MRAYIQDTPTRIFIPLTLLACAVSLTVVWLAVDEHWGWLLMAGGAALTLGLLVSRPIISLLLVFSWLPFQPLLNDLFARPLPLVAIVKDVLMVIFVVAVVFYHFVQRREWYFNPTIYLLICFAMASGLYALIAPYWMRGLLELRFLALYPLIILLVANCLETTADLLRVLRRVATMGIVVVSYGLLQYVFHFDVPYRIGSGDVTLRMARFNDLAIVSTFGTRPDFGAYVTVIFLLFLQVKLWTGWRSAAPLRWAMLGATTLCVALTYSRSAWAAFAVGLIVTLYLRNPTRGMLGAAALGMGVLLFYGTELLARSSSLNEAATSSESFHIRLRYWPLVASYALTQPLGLGLGMVGGPHLFEARAQADIYGNLQYDPQVMFNPNAELGPDNMLAVTDNSYLKLLAQGGFPLLLLFLALVVTILRLGRELLTTVQDILLRDLTIWALASFAALLTMFVFVDFMESAPSISLYWLAVGVLCYVQKLSAGAPRSRLGKLI